MPLLIIRGIKMNKAEQFAATYCNVAVHGVTMLIRLNFVMGHTTVWPYSIKGTLMNILTARQK